MRANAVISAIKLSVIALAGLILQSLPLLAADSVSILIYHRFGENRYPSTNIRLEQFDAHLDALERGGYQVLSLIEAVRRLKQNLELPERAVVITVDDAFASSATDAWPKLRTRGMPMTLFVSTDPVDENRSGYLTWDDIRELQRAGVEIGHHGAAHLHMPKAGVDAAKADLEKASARFEAELGKVPRLFAYPYGEYSPEIRDMVKDAGFDAAVAQFSSPATYTSDLFAIPRFALNEAYGSEERFRLVAGARALPVKDVLPRSPMLTSDTNPPLFGFTVDPVVGDTGSINCFPSHIGRAADLVRPHPRRVEVRFAEPFPKGRSRINCTMPGPDGRFFWYGAFFLRPGAEE